MEAAFFRWLPIPDLGTSGMEIERQLLQQNLSVYCSYRFTFDAHIRAFYACRNFISGRRKTA